MSRLQRQYHRSNILSSSFCWSTTCSPSQSRGEHDFTNHQISFAVFCTATTRISTAYVRLHESSNTVSSGITADSTNRHPGTRLIAFSPISNTLSTRSSTGSSSRPPPAACSTRRTPSTDAHRDDPTQRRSLVELRSNSRRILLRLRLYHRFNRRKDPDRSGVHVSQTGRSRDGERVT